MKLKALYAKPKTDFATLIDAMTEVSKYQPVTGILPANLVVERQ